MDSLVAVDSKELIGVKQLPVIEDRLDVAFSAVQDRLAAMSGLAVTEENYKEIKKTRADLNKEFGELEGLRKTVKQAIEAPYKRFEGGAYKRLADAYRNAIDSLDGEIKAVESDLRTQRQKELFEYYEEYRKSLGLSLDFAAAQRSGIKIGLSGSMKSYKDQARAWLDKIDSELKMIETLEDRDEVLAEYRVLLSVTDAVRVVADRKKRIEEERQRREEEAAAKAQRDELFAAADVSQEEAVSSPTVQVAVPQEDVSDVYSAAFRVYGTLDELRELKAFLVDNGYQYESI